MTVTIGRRSARRRQARSFVVAAAMMAGCTGAPPPGPPNAGSPAPDTTRTDVRAPQYFVEGRVLYRHDGGGTRALLALDSASAPPGVPALPATYVTRTGAALRVRAERLLHVVPSPGGRWVAWESSAVHDLLGVVPAEGGEPAILDLFWDSSGDTLLWAPGDRYLAVRYTPPTGYATLPVYDAQAGSRLAAPWDTACTPHASCRVRTARWEAPFTLVVGTEAPGGRTADYRVDVRTLSAAGARAGIQRGCQSSAGARVSRVACEPSARAR